MNMGILPANFSNNFHDLQQEIKQLELNLHAEISATEIHNLRLRLTFLQWKLELLQMSGAR